MELLILGMVIFVMVHLTQSFAGIRRRLIKWRGDAVYKIGYSCFALIGLLLIFVGT